MTATQKRAKKTAPKRAYGSGSITPYKTRAGTRWRYFIEVPVDPARLEAGMVRHNQAGFETYDAADEAVTLLRADAIRGQVVTRSRDTFGAYARVWLDGHAVGNGTRMYIQRVIDAVDPYIGSMRLQDVRPTDLAATYRGLERGTHQKPSKKRPRKGLATSTVARYANWVNTIFLAAVDEGIIAKSPANTKHSGRPKGERAKRVKPFSIWTPDELNRFCDWALAEDEPWAYAWVIFSRTGLRSGELLTLQWGDLDFDKKRMRIERALHYDETLPLGERYVIGLPKGDKTRTITFDQTCADILTKWRQELPAALTGTGGTVTPLFGRRSEDPVFPALAGRAATQSGLYAAFKRVQKHYRKANPDLDLPPLTVHELRHTHASLLFAAGQSVKVVQERLGHASAQVTLNTYAHLLPDAQSLAAAALENLLAETS